jgi:NDP-sugar pyrophosphorylase family protein
MPNGPAWSDAGAASHDRRESSVIDHVIVMAATPGRKMERLTATRPKAMLPILGKPMIAWVMEGYYKAGIRRFTVVVGEQDGSVAGWLSSNWHKDARLTFAPQGPQRGTASTLYATRSLIDGPFLIAACDILLPEEHTGQLAAYFDTHPSDVAALSLFYAPDDVSSGANVLLDPRGNVVYISEAPTGGHQDNMTALPVYAFTPAILGYLDRVPVVEQSGERALAAGIQLMIDDRMVVGALETGWRIKLNDPEDILTANILLMAQESLPVLNSPIPPTARVIPPVHIDPGVMIGQGATLGPNVYIETGSVIGANASIVESVILGVRIGAGQSIHREVVDQERV